MYKDSLILASEIITVDSYNDNCLVTAFSFKNVGVKKHWIALKTYTEITKFDLNNLIDAGKKLIAIYNGDIMYAMSYAWLLGTQLKNNTYLTEQVLTKKLNYSLKKDESASQYFNQKANKIDEQRICAYNGAKEFYKLDNIRKKQLLDIVLDTCNKIAQTEQALIQKAQ